MLEELVYKMMHNDAEDVCNYLQSKCGIETWGRGFYATVKDIINAVQHNDDKTEEDHEWEEIIVPWIVVENVPETREITLKRIPCDFNKVLVFVLNEESRVLARFEHFDFWYCFEEGAYKLKLYIPNQISIGTKVMIHYETKVKGEILTTNED